MSALDEIVTISEVVDQCAISEIAVRKACERAISKGELFCRKSGGTWIMLKSWAFGRWEPLPTDEEIDDMIDAEDDVDHSYMLDEIDEKGKRFGKNILDDLRGSGHEF